MGEADSVTSSRIHHAISLNTKVHYHDNFFAFDISMLWIFHSHIA